MKLASLLVVALLVPGCDSLDVDVADAGIPDLTGRTVPDGTFLVRGDELGASVSVDGTTMAVGAPGTDVETEQDEVLVDNAGAVHVFELADGQWSMAQRLIAPVPRRGDRFGSSVSLDGDVLVVGAPGDSAFGDGTGTVYAFTRSGSVWTPMPQLR